MLVSNIIKKINLLTKALLTPQQKQDILQFFFLERVYDH